MTIQNSTPPTASTPAPRPPVHRRGRGRNPYQHPDLAPVPRMLTLVEASEVLRVKVDALRARCRRAAVADAQGNVTAPLAPGVVAVKMGANTWRVRFDAPGGGRP